MKTFVLKDVNSDSTLRLTNLVETPNTEGHFRLTASFSSMSLTGACAVEDYGAESWGAYFEDISQNLHGWSGEKRVESYQGFLSFVATSDSQGHVFIIATIKTEPTPTWVVQVSLTLEFGQLVEVANEARAFFGEPIRVISWRAMRAATQPSVQADRP